MGENITSAWQLSLSDTYDEFIGHLIEYMPHILGAMVLLILGWVVAHALRIASRKLAASLGLMLRRVASVDGDSQEKLIRSYALLTSKVVFWIVLVFFIAAATNLLGWQLFSRWMDSFISQLPNLIAGSLIILAGFLLANGIKAAVIRIANSAGIEQSEIFARVVQIVVLFTMLVIGIEQIGINVDFLTNTLIVTVGIFLAGGALAFAFGAGTLVANIIGAQYVRKHCRLGEQMQTGDVFGTVVEVTNTSVVLETEFGRAVVPAKLFQEQVSSFRSEPHESSEVAVKSDSGSD